MSLRCCVFTLTLTFGASVAWADTFDLISQVPGLETAKLSEIPANTAASEEAGLCSVVLPAPNTAAGKSLTAEDWYVTAEIEASGLTFVSFVGKTEPGTSGSCLIRDGNIGIYRDDRPLALIYADTKSGRSIGSLQALDGGRLRIWDGDYLSAPLADLQLVESSLVIVRHISERDSFCADAASAPNIYGLPIHLARRLLLSEGWQPAPRTETSGGGLDMGGSLPELQDCSGTGFGYCAWAYVNKSGQILRVTTAGEPKEGSSPVVAGFEVTCGAQ